MALDPVYTEIALYCPPWVEPGAPLSPSADPAAPLTFNEFSLGQTTTVPLRLNQDNRRSEIIAQHGGAGAYAVVYGLDLSVSSGLTLAYSLGCANVDGPQRLAAGTLALAGLVYNWVWITSGGVVTFVTGSKRDEVPDPPTSAAAFLGRVLCDGSSIVEIDYSGRHYQRGGKLWRRTADVGMPTDEPSATLQFRQRSSDGVWEWDGVEYFASDADVETLMDTNDALEQRLTELEYLFRAKLRADFHALALQDIPADPLLANELIRALAEG